MLEKRANQLLEKIKKEDKKINSFLYVNDNVVAEAAALEKKSAKGRLYGKFIGIKSNINVKGMPVSCASKTLEDYKGTFDATVIKKIKAEDGLIIGMLNMDEFAAGASGETSAFGAVRNPKAPDRIAGGSSSGSAAAVAAEFCDMSLGSDTGGSIRNPAAHCSVVGAKPSYGLVSRYGLIDLSMSLDQIGTFARNVEDAMLLLDVIKGKDEKDTMSVDSEKLSISDLKKVKVGVLKFKEVNPQIQKICDEKIAAIKKLEWNVSEINIAHIDLAVQTYYLLVYAEFFSATRRFDGLRYGKKIEDSCGEEVLRRILGGSEITKAEYENAYYEKALKVKELIKDEFEKVFKTFDCVVCPTVPIFPWKIGEGKKMKAEKIYAADALTIPANLAGICGISVPAGVAEQIPVGLQILCDRNQESKMFSVAKKVEELEI